MNPKRQFTGLSFPDAFAALKGEHEKNPGADMLMYRENGLKDVYDVAIVDCYCYAELLSTKWTTEEILAHNWVFEDRGDEDPFVPPVGPLLGRLSLSRDDVLSAVSAEVGHFYYKNPDCHKIAPGVCKRLGFDELPILPMPVE